MSPLVFGAETRPSNAMQEQLGTCGWANDLRTGHRTLVSSASR